MKSFFKPTKVTWMIFGLFGSVTAAFYFSGHSGFLETLAWVILIVDLPVALLTNLIFKLLGLSENGEFYFSVVFLGEVFYWYVLGSIVSGFWYKLKKATID
jgi:hypothetical protein